MRVILASLVLSHADRLLGAFLVLSPNLWHSTGRGNGPSLAFVPFHLWCWLPFALLAFTALHNPYS